MTLLQFLADWVLHLDHHLVELVARYDLWIYALLFLVIFAETGLVVTPFLPGDSLLFATGALTAVDASGTLRLPWLLLLLSVAAIGGNSLNYQFGRLFGHRVFDGRHRLFRLEYLRRAEDFFRRHGGMAVAISRFMPILRTFTPFVAGMSRMPAGHFQLWNVIGGSSWVLCLLGGGFLFGNLPVVRDNFGVVTLLIIGVSLLPLVWALLHDRRQARARRG
jgi:membrane-associated protein